MNTNTKVRVPRKLSLRDEINTEDRIIKPGPDGLYPEINHKQPLLLKLRNWVIYRLAGNSPIMIGIEIDGYEGIILRGPNAIMSNCIIKNLKDLKGNLITVKEA